MGVFDLILIFSVFIVLLSFACLLFALATHRWILFRRILVGLGIYLGLYALALVSVSLLSPQRVLPMHELRCYDDWCASVERVEIQPAIREVQAQGTFFLVTIQVTSKAKRIRQRARDAAVFLLDDQGRRFDPSLEGQQALEIAGLAGQPLYSLVDAGGSFMHTAVFDLPADANQPALVFSHGVFPGVIIIGDSQSFLHKPTIVPLTPP
jgi:hypothetical protein